MKTSKTDLGWRAWITKPLEQKWASKATRAVGLVAMILCLGVGSLPRAASGTQSGLANAALPQTVGADAFGQQNQRPSGGGSGSDIPWPFESANHKVELADGETYILSGRVVFAPGPVSVDPAPYLEIDFKEHPWLESAKRKLWPFYPLENGEIDWKKWENQRVIVPLKAKGQILVSTHSDPIYMLILKPIAEPVRGPSPSP